MPKRIPVSAAKNFAIETGCAQVIVMAWDGQTSHVVTWGATAIDCDQAAQGGDLMKATMGWPHDPTCMPSRVKKLQAELTKAKASLEAAYLAGFMSSGEGNNGEVGDGINPESDAYWLERRDRTIGEILAS